jgi:hypothetical protein
MTMSNDETQTLTKEVEHNFTPEELRNLGIALSYAIGDIESLEAEKAEFMKAHKEGLKETRTKVKLLAEKIRTGSEIRMVECRLEKDFLSNSVKTYRLDTGELVEERSMTPEERQLFLVPETEPTGPRQVDLT